MKSHANTLTKVAELLIRESLARCSASESAERDILTLISRVEAEGLSFLTITLPSFGADFERSLSQGFVDSKNFRNFRKFRQIPAFLRGIVSQVFDADTGRILYEPSVEAIECVRQISYAFKKLKMPCTPERVYKTYERFIKDELDLSVALSPEDTFYFESICDLLWGNVFGLENIQPSSFTPRHGPGATAEGISGNQKYVFSSWHSRLEPYFPIFPNVFTSVDAFGSIEFNKLSVVSETNEMPVRVITVPKTLKSPRIIAIEPVCMQYTQQAISKVLVRTLESSKLTAGHVNFTDQTINQRIAMNSSSTGQMATLDLSSASDRVPWSLALAMFNRIPDLRASIDACRSRRAKLPVVINTSLQSEDGVLSLRKFASMGSALCFPVESMYFYTLCVGALLRKRKLPVNLRNIFLVSREVYVYGDDIIVPTNDAEAVIDFLQKYHCKVNMSKSFWTGKFRESCGMDAFSGRQVTPTYIREMPPDDRQSVSAIISWVKTANLLLQRQFFSTSEYLFSICEQHIGKLPIVGDRCAGLGRISQNKSYSIERWNKKTHVPEVRTWVACPVYRKDILSGYPALLKALLSLEHSVKECSTDVDHLKRTARYGAVTLKRRWVQP